MEDDNIIDQAQRRENAESNVSPVHQENFFTKNFDDEKADDLFEKLKNTTTTDLK